MSAPLSLPPNADLRQLRNRAKDLLKAHAAAAPDLAQRARQALPEWAELTDEQVFQSAFALKDAQRLIACEYGFDQWADLKRHLEAQPPAVLRAAAPSPNAAFDTEVLIAFFEAVRSHDIDALRTSLEAHPGLIRARVPQERMHLRGESFSEAFREEALSWSQPGIEWDETRTATALHMATSTGWIGSLEVARILLDHGADPNALGYEENNDYCAPIVIATWEGGLDMMRLLLEHGADVSGEQGISALGTAASHNQIDRFDLLVEHGAPASPWLLIKAGLADRVIAAVDADASLLTARDERGYTLLHAAAARIYTDGVEGLAESARAVAATLIERGAVLDLFAAGALDDVAGVQTILRDDPTQRDARLPDGATPLEFAVKAGSHAAAAVLLEAGADPDGGRQMLYRAARSDDTEMCRLLLTHGAAATGEAVYQAAWRNSDPECLALILEHGGDPNAMSFGTAPLHWAGWANTEAVRLLLAAGADPNLPAPGHTNDTPLHFAVARPDSVAALLEAGADAAAANDNGDTALDVAQRDGYTDAAALLLEHRSV